MYNPSANIDVPTEFDAHPMRNFRADAGTQFNSAEFTDECLRKGINVSIAAPKHQEMNGLTERTWQSIRNLAYSFLNFARVGTEFTDMALEHAAKIIAVLPLKGLQANGKSTTPYFLFYGRKPNVRKLRVLFCPCIYKVYERTRTVTVNKSTGQRQINRFNSSNHPQRGVLGIHVGIPRGQAGYLIWEPRTATLRVSANVTFDETFASAGPRMHFAFADALPVSDAFTSPIADHFRPSDQADDHHGPAQVAYHEDVPSDGYHRVASSSDPTIELVPLDEIDTAPLLEEPTGELLPLWSDEDECPDPSPPCWICVLGQTGDKGGKSAS